MAYREPDLTGRPRSIDSEQEEGLTVGTQELDLTGRPWRIDSEHEEGLTVGTWLWMSQPAFNLQGERAAMLAYRQRLENTEPSVSIPSFEVVTTNSMLEPRIHASWRLLPFRCLEDTHLPAAIRQRWEASVTASKCAEWRQWFQTLDQTQQQAHVESIAKSTKETFWAGLWLEYEEYSKPRQARFVAAAARALVILEQENLRKRMEEITGYRGPMPHITPAMLERYILDVPGERGEPRSECLTPNSTISLGVRLAPSYFRLPINTFRFATQIFQGKPYEEAVAEQKANFASWSRESRVRRIEGQPDFVVWGNIAVHKDAVPKLTPKKNQPQTGKHRYQKRRQVKSG